MLPSWAPFVVEKKVKKKKGKNKKGKITAVDQTDLKYKRCP